MMTINEPFKVGTLVNSKDTSNKTNLFYKEIMDGEQKLQLKSQILAYRMIRRNAKLPQIVKKAATNETFKTNCSTNDREHLSKLFQVEYSGPRTF